MTDESNIGGFFKPLTEEFNIVSFISILYQLFPFFNGRRFYILGWKFKERNYYIWAKSRRSKEVQRNYSCIKTKGKGSCSQHSKRNGKKFKIN